MLIILSDLHFVDGSSGDHNLPPSAFAKALCAVGIDPADPDATAVFLRERHIDSVTVLLLGDIFDITRSHRWFEPVGGGPASVRPWGTNTATGSNSEPVRKKARAILEGMIGTPPTADLPPERRASIQKIADTLALLRNVKTDLSRQGIAITYTYVPGNHDRILYADPEMRKMIRRVLPLGAGSFASPYVDDDHRVVAFHGHEIDVMNFGRGYWEKNPYVRTAYGLPSLGEAITIEIACRLPYLAEQRLLPHLRSAAARAEVRGILENMDNVRPVTAIFKWLEKALGPHYAALNTELDATVRDLFDEFGGIKFVVDTSENIDQRYIPSDSGFLLKLAASMCDLDFHEVATKINSLHQASFLLEKATSSSRDPYDRLRRIREHTFYREVVYPRVCRFEGSKPRYVVYGHTHTPEVVPITGGLRENILINTGTFRPRYIACGDKDGTDGFIRHKTLSFAAIYRDHERKKNAPVKRYEFWHGILADDE